MHCGECCPGPSPFGFCLLLLLLPRRPLPQPPGLGSGVSLPSSPLPSAPKRSPLSAPHRHPLPPRPQLAVDFCLQRKLPGSSGPQSLLCPPLRLPPPGAPHPPAFPSAWVSTVISRAPAPIRARRPSCHWPRRIFRRPAGWGSGSRLPRLPGHEESRGAGRPVTCPNSSLPPLQPGAPEEIPREPGGQEGAAVTPATRSPGCAPDARTKRAARLRVFCGGAVFFFL